MKQISQLILTMLLAAFAAGCSSALQLDSARRHDEITIDGDQTDWREAMTFIEGKNVSIGVANDADYLYVCLASTDRSLRRQMLARGFTLWLDGEGGKARTFGIRFPIGMIDAGFLPMAGRDRDDDPETMRERFAASVLELEIIGPKKNERIRRKLTELRGILVKLSEPGDRLVYEIRVPLVQSEQHPYAVGANASQKLGLGFETTVLDKKKLREQTGRGGFDGRPGGFSGPAGGGRGGFGGGRGGGRGQRPQMPERFKLWIKVMLDSDSNRLSAGVQSKL